MSMCDGGHPVFVPQYQKDENKIELVEEISVLSNKIDEIYSRIPMDTYDEILELKELVKQLIHGVNRICITIDDLSATVDSIRPSQPPKR